MPSLEEELYSNLIISQSVNLHFDTFFITLEKLVHFVNWVSQLDPKWYTSIDTITRSSGLEEDFYSDQLVLSQSVKVR